MDEIERTIRRMPDEELIQMVKTDFQQYTDEALFIARDELSSRRVSVEGSRAGSDSQTTGGNAAERTEPKRPAGGSSDIARILKAGEAGRELLLGAMLREELQYVECYEALSDFVSSMNIRCGEYQGNTVVFRKMDRENFMLFAEEEGEDGINRITGCVTIGVIATIASVGGISGIVIIVIKFFGVFIANWFTKIYELKLNKKLEAYKGSLNRKLYVTKIRFDAEFQIYRELSKSFFYCLKIVALCFKKYDMYHLVLMKRTMRNM